MIWLCVCVWWPNNEVEDNEAMLVSIADHFIIFQIDVRQAIPMRTFVMHFLIEKPS